MYSTFLRDLINGDVPRVELFRLLPRFFFSGIIINIFLFYFFLIFFLNRLISVFFSLFASEKHKSILPLAEDAFGSVIAQFLEVLFLFFTSFPNFLLFLFLSFFFFPSFFLSLFSHL